MVLTNFDHLVIDILGKDSPVLDGLEIPESSGSDAAQTSVPIVKNNPTTAGAYEEEPLPKK